MIIKITGYDLAANSYIVCRYDVCFLVDPNQQLDLINFHTKDKTIIGIILTHAHSDHLGLIAKFNVPIYLHHLELELLKNHQSNGYLKPSVMLDLRRLNFQSIKDSDKLQLADKLIEVIHTPGHTKGSICLLYDDCLLTGDTIFKMSVGRHDLYSGNLFELKKSVLKILSLKSSFKIYPGHDENTTIREEKKTNPFYLNWIKQRKK